MDRPVLIGPDALHRPAAETPGVDHREAFADDHVWAGRSRTDACTWSGWHVHPGHDTYVFQIQDASGWNSAPAAATASRAGRATSSSSPRAWCTVRGNPGTEPNEAIVFRVGEGELLVNVDGPWAHICKMAAQPQVGFWDARECAPGP